MMTNHAKFHRNPIADSKVMAQNGFGDGQTHKQTHRAILLCFPHLGIIKLKEYKLIGRHNW